MSLKTGATWLWTAQILGGTPSSFKLRGSAVCAALDPPILGLDPIQRGV